MTATKQLADRLLYEMDNGIPITAII